MRVQFLSPTHSSNCILQLANKFFWTLSPERTSLKKDFCLEICCPNWLWVWCSNVFSILNSERISLKIVCCFEFRCSISCWVSSSYFFLMFWICSSLSFLCFCSSRRFGCSWISFSSCWREGIDSLTFKSSLIDLTIEETIMCSSALLNVSWGLPNGKLEQDIWTLSICGDSKNVWEASEMKLNKFILLRTRGRMFFCWRDFSPSRMNCSSNDSWSSVRSFW